MADLSHLQLAAVAYQAGLRNPAKISTAVAVARAESGGNPKAYNGRGRDRSYGLWQINMKPEEVGDRAKELGISSAEALFDPLTNAKAMVKISKSGADWSPWTTYNGLRYFAELPFANTATAALLADPSKAAKYVQEAGSVVGDAAGAVGDAVTAPIDALAGTIADAVQTPAQILNWLKDAGTWVRIAYFVGGGALVVGGLVIFARPVTAAATNVIPMGKVATVAGKLVK
jgi:hypothetical protein